MKIVSVCIHYPSPSHPTRGIFVERRLKALAKLAHVRVISPRPWFPFVRPHHESDSVSPGEMPVYRPRMPYLPGMAKGWDGYWLERCLRHELSTLRDADRIDLVDAHFEYPEGVGAVNAAQRLGLPTVVTLRGLLNKYLKTACRRGKILSALQRATAVISVSQSLKDLAIEHGVPAERITVIPNGIDFDVFSPPETRLRLNGEWIVAVGHVEQRKGYHVLLEAFAELTHRKPDARLYIIGRTDTGSAYSRRIDALIDKHGLRDKVTLLGECPPHSVAAWLHKASVFCLPSYHEGCCNAVLEALSCGAPVVTTPVGDNSKYIRNGVNGYLVPVGNASALSAALHRSLEQDWDAHTISSAVTRSWDVVASEVMQTMERAITRPG